MPYRVAVLAVATLASVLVTVANGGAFEDGPAAAPAAVGQAESPVSPGLDSGGVSATAPAPPPPAPDPTVSPVTDDPPVDGQSEVGPGAEAYSRVAPSVPAESAAERPEASGLSLDTSLSELEAAEAGLAEYDPWSGFNEKTFAFNYNFDRYLLKPVARAYDTVVPNVVQRAIHNLFENVGSIRRLINTALQGRFNAFGQEFGRLFINTLFGLGGLIDAAPSFGVAPRAEADAGQTLAVWGVKSGPYLVLPFFAPSTARDTAGTALDIVMNPLTWIIPSPFFVAAASQAGRMVNERSMNLELFEDVEESVLDLYSSVRNAYFQRRHRLVQEALLDSPFGRRERLILSSPLGREPEAAASVTPPPAIETDPPAGQ